jgi:hypothetical protein
MVARYFLSSDSQPFRTPFLMETAGMTTASFADSLDAYDRIIALCSRFWAEYNTALSGAVQEIYLQLGARRSLQTHDSSGCPIS